jgi:crotonobetainyl-CoA:carnitine CoA-transferase CaiB-like acyl-CoA transferase
MMDVLAAHQLKEGILCALYQRLQTSKGAYVQCTLEESGLASLVNQATNYLMANNIPRRQGSLHPNIAPYGETFETKDGALIVLAVGSEKQFEQLCSLLEIPPDERFSSNQKRVIHRKAMAEVMQERFVLKTADEWLALFIPKNIPAGKVKRMDEVMAGSTAQALILEEQIDGVHTKRMKSAVFSISPGS